MSDILHDDVRFSAAGDIKPP